MVYTLHTMGAQLPMANRILISKNSIEIQCARNDIDTQSKLVSINPLHSNRTKTVFTCSIHFIPEVLQLLRGVTKDNIDTAPINIQRFFYNELSIRENMKDLLANGPRQSCIVNKNLTLMRHQQLGREIAQYQDRFAFFYDTRTGKTPLSLAIINDDIAANPHHKWLVLCPLILIDNAWMEDAAKFVPHLRFVNCHASTKEKRLERISTTANVYITNTESFVKYKQYFDKIEFAGCIVDESSDIKSQKSKISKELVEYSWSIPRLYLLSGTPAANGEYEYFMQIRCVDYYGFQQSYAQFSNYFFFDTSKDHRYQRLVLRPDRHDEFYTTLKRYCIFIDKEDVLNTPGRTFHEVVFELPVELKKHYNQMKHDLYIELQNELDGETEKYITAVSAAAKINKLNQIASGFVIDTRAKKDNKLYKDDLTWNKLQEWYLLDKYRFQKLDELLQSEHCVGQQVLIWANYRSEFELLKKMLGERVRCIYGATSLTEKNEAIKLFKERKIQYLAANPASADKGLTLTNAHIAIYFSLNHSYELFKQSSERIYADISKQPDHCHYYIFIAKGTINRVIYSDVLLGKQQASNAVLNHLKGGNL